VRRQRLAGEQPESALGSARRGEQEPACYGGGQGGDSFLPEQALGLASILAAYTSGSAWVDGLDAVTGSIREGFDADFAIVNADLAHFPAQEICQAIVTQTWIRGQVVYQQH